MPIDGLVPLYLAAASIAFAHTLLGPDHYLPFVAMSRAGGWSVRKTVVITLACGMGHVLSSAVLGLAGIGFGIVVLKLEHLEQVRGDLAGWLLLGFGLMYFLWGIRRAVRNQPHSHFHAHADGVVHAHKHTHHTDHVHVHTILEADQNRDCKAANAIGVTPWVLFTIFLFGPCEPLIPLLMYAAANGNTWAVASVTIVFGVTTLVTMTVVVLCTRYAFGLTPLPRLQRFGHAVAGLVVIACGIAVRVGF